MSLDNTSPLSLEIVWRRGINYKRIQISFGNNVLLHKYIGLIEQLVSNLDVPITKLDIRYSHLDGQFLRYKSYMDNCFKVVKITGTCCRKTEKVKILTEKNEVIWLISNISNYWLRFPDGVFTHSRKDGYFKFMFKPCANNQIANTRMKRRLDPVLEVATKIDELELNEGASDSVIQTSNQMKQQMNLFILVPINLVKSNQ